MAPDEIWEANLDKGDSVPYFSSKKALIPSINRNRIWQALISIFIDFAAHQHLRL